MKKLIIAIFAIAICACIYVTVNREMEKKAEQKALAIEEDYAKIEKLRKAMSKMAASKSDDALGGGVRWVMFDVAIANQDQGPFFKKLKKELGSDFDSVLSNGDRLFAGMLVGFHKYKIYINNPRDDNFMIYPDWNYTGLPKR